MGLLRFRLPAAPSARAPGLRPPRRVFVRRASASDDADDDPPPVLPPRDWRAFRASLVAADAVAAGEPVGPAGDVWSARWTPENVHLLQQQDREGLAREPLWAHATNGVEVGGLLIASPDAPVLLGDDRAWQLVALVTSHAGGGEPSSALILNRPSSATLGDLLDWGLTLGTDAATASLAAALADAPVYLGGFFAPNRLAAQPIALLHAEASPPGAVELAPGLGVYTGGGAALAAAVAAGAVPLERVRVVAGALGWAPGGLEAAAAAGVWWTAAASRALILKPCTGLPVPLWRETLGLCGGEYGKAAKKRG